MKSSIASTPIALFMLLSIFCCSCFANADEQLPQGQLRRRMQWDSPNEVTYACHCPSNSIKCTCGTTVRPEIQGDGGNTSQPYVMELQGGQSVTVNMQCWDTSTQYGETSMEVADYDITSSSMSVPAFAHGTYKVQTTTNYQQWSIKITNEGSNQAMAEIVSITCSA